MSLLTAPEQEAVRRTRAWLLLLGGLILLIVVTAVLLALRSTEIAAQGANSAPVGQSAIDDGEALPAAGVAGGEAPEPGSGGSPLTVDNPVEALALEACSQFAAGATVVDFAAWFEAEVGPVGAEEEALFQTTVLRALSQTCPEVIPSG
ncbi:MAG TPA: hypothetical protein VJR05_11120 [Acidimicrobiia bacterium]|nr:hypothetical protein [Acidimicrobiia bacterium]